jgi:hypothetical protein
LKNITKRLGMLFVTLLAFLQVSAYDFECNGIYYNVKSYDDMTVAVTYGGQFPYSGTESYVGDITIPSVVNYKGRQFTVTSIGYSAFYCSRELTSVDIPESVTEIGKDAFQACSSLRTVKISEGVTSIGDYAFDRCTSLADFSMPNSLESIGEVAFFGCNFKKIVIRSNVTSIGRSAFQDCTNLTEVVMEEGSSVLNIGDANVFHACPLVSVYMGRELSSSSYSGVFEDQTSLKSVQIGKKVKSIGAMTFRGCTALENITIPSNVQRIRSSAFENSGLKTIVIEDSDASLAVDYTQRVKNGVSYCDFYTFSSDSLTDVYVGRNITPAYSDPKYSPLFPGKVEYITIGDKVTMLSPILNNTSNLVSLQVGSGITVLPDMSSGYENLENLSLTATTPPYFSSTVPFSDSQYLSLRVVVPLGAKSVYAAKGVWSRFWNLMESDSLGYASAIKGVQVDKIANSFISLTTTGIQLLGDAPQQVSVYGLDGSERVSAKLAPNEILPLESGTYVVRVGRKSIKVKL